MNIIVTFIAALPDIIKLLQALQKQADEAETDRKVRDDLKTIHEAFNAKDPAKLNALFNSK